MRLDPVGAVADGADEVFEQVFQGRHGDRVTVGVGDQRQVAVAAAQPGWGVGQRQRVTHPRQRRHRRAVDDGVGIVDERQHVLDVQVSDETAGRVDDREP